MFWESFRSDEILAVKAFLFLSHGRPCSVRFGLRDEGNRSANIASSFLDDSSRVTDWLWPGSLATNKKLSGPDFPFFESSTTPLVVERPESQSTGAKSIEAKRS